MLSNCEVLMQYAVPQVHRQTTQHSIQLYSRHPRQQRLQLCLRRAHQQRFQQGTQRPTKTTQQYRFNWAHDEPTKEPNNTVLSASMMSSTTAPSTTNTKEPTNIISTALTKISTTSLTISFSTSPSTNVPLRSLVVQTKRQPQTNLLL